KSLMENNIDQTYINRALSITKSMVTGTFLVAAAQGALGGVFAWMAGLDYILTLTIIMIIFSVIPLLGTGLITIPIGIYLLATGNYWQGAIMLLGQALFVSTIDNVLRSYLSPKEAGLHPGLLLLSFFGGIQVFGPIGIIYGPVLMILFVTSVEMYLVHYS
ncbi:MAG: AI-2E family transporter, partial [Candidatus Roizmanbacteria bacterium]